MQYLDNECDISIFAEISKEGSTIPCLINERGDTHQFVFIWEVQPVHTTSIQDDVMASILDGMLEVRGLEQFTFINRVSPSVSGTPRNDLIAKNQHRHREQLTQAGLRREISYYFMATYTVSQDAKEPEGPLEAVLAKLQTIWEKKVTGDRYEFDQQARLLALNGAHTQWLEYEQILSSKFKLTARPLDCDELYRYCWDLFNAEDCPPLPYRLIANLDRAEFIEVDRSGNEVDEENNVFYEMVHYIVPPEACPRAESGDTLFLPNKDRYVGCISFEDIPDDYGSPQQKYRFFWDSIVRDSLHQYEMEICTQITYCDPKKSLKMTRKFAQQQRGDAKSRDEKNKRDKAIDIAAEQAEQAQSDIIKGDRPVFVSVSINVYAPSDRELIRACRNIRNRFSRPTVAHRESDYAWKIWLQTTPIRAERLGTSQDVGGMIGNDFRLKLAVSAALGLVQLIGVRSSGKDGPEFISQEGGIPLKISLEDGFGSPRHGCIEGKSGSGKSAMAADFLDYARIRGMSISIQDLPDASGRGTYPDWVRFHGGIVIDTARTPNNLIEMPVFEDEGDRDDYLVDIAQIIGALVLGKDSGKPVDEIEAIIETSVSRFFSAPDIQERIYQARHHGIGTRQWQNWPTLHDYYQTIGEHLNPENSPKTQEAIDHIRLMLRAWLESPYADKIASPSAFDISQHQIVLFSLRGVKGEKQSRVFGLSSFNASIRRSIQAKRAFYFCDELSVQLTFPAIARYVGHSMATARKSGCSLLLALQDCNAIAQSPVSSQIIDNLSYLLVGRVNNGSVDSFYDVHKLPPELVRLNALDSFKPVKREMRSNWLVEDDGQLTPAKYFASPIQLGLIVNNEEEARGRQIYFGQYKVKEEAAARFGAYLSNQYRKELPLFTEIENEKIA